MCEVLFLTPTNSPTLQTLRQTSDSPGKRLSPTKLPCNFRHQSLVSGASRTSNGHSNYHDPLFRFDNLLEWLTERRKTVYLLLNKGCNSGTVQWKGCTGQSIGASKPSLGPPPSWHLNMFPNPEILWGPSFSCFFFLNGVSITWTWLINVLAMGD